MRRVPDLFVLSVKNGAATRPPGGAERARVTSALSICPRFMRALIPQRGAASRPSPRGSHAVGDPPPPRILSLIVPWGRRGAHRVRAFSREAPPLRSRVPGLPAACCWRFTYAGNRWEPRL